MALTRQLIDEALSTVEDPDLGRDLVSLGMVKAVEIKGRDIAIEIELTTPACPLKDRIRDDIVAAIQSRAGDAAGSIEVTFSSRVRSGARGGAEGPLPGVRHVIAVGAGKGGVGKSTVATILAVGLARLGARAGLLDGDIYGPSVKTLLGLDDVPPQPPRGNILVPFETCGPMAHGAFKQLAMQTDWGDLDYLIVDLPPGTGDVPLTLTQLLPLTGAVVVCTPQRVALDDARRAVRMFQQLGVTVLGIVENMSTFICAHGEEYDIFGRGGAEYMAQEMSLPFLGALPIRMELRENGDAGTPLRNWQTDPRLAERLDELCRNLAAQVSISTLSGRPLQPTISIT
jgi:ATP-binding protein involved in chromosome partitioning